MNTSTLDTAIAEARRFLERATELQKENPPASIHGRPIHVVPSAQSGAVRRASMDLTRALAALRSSN